MPTQQEIAVAAQKMSAAEQMQFAMQQQVAAEFRAVTHEIYVFLLRDFAKNCHADNVTQDDLRRLARQADLFAPYVLEIHGLCKVKPWPEGQQPTVESKKIIGE